MGLPQPVTRGGKPAVAVLSEHDFEVLQRNAVVAAVAPLNFVDHLMAIPRADIEAVEELEGEHRLDMQPREVNFS